ncbi:hypothetical protein BDV36DRAFT_243501 [Aspergillus pseudocaelatus]|uniref:Uncharacterized protein n=1 Tax=Aspergillus pseudocaelatus TaxID=1825620 RepID=A0ABQ6X274_9EURO|nr:hypothetical protein BDV36DRAFT_243501 [Aspergillus pseudocaelatus]
MCGFNEKCVGYGISDSNAEDNLRASEKTLPMAYVVVALLVKLRVVKKKLRKRRICK